MISLYFHFPFCNKKCPYCHFFVLPNNDLLKKQFLPALLKEWEYYAPIVNNHKITSIYFGGGTPTLFIQGIEAILRRCNSQCEITVETNPEDVTLEKMVFLKELGVNRISIGTQSFNNTLLKHLGRTHTAQQGIEAVHISKHAGIDNITIDLMYELPHQTFPMWEETVEKALDLPITHLSLYNLIFEPHTIFHKKKKTLQPHLPSEEEGCKMLEFGCKRFENHGLKRYEISAFGKPSIHNSGYWSAREFLGFGPSACSYIKGKRFQNVCHLNKYIKFLDQGKCPVDFEEKLSPLHSLHEKLAIGLRLTNGISLPPVPQSTKHLLNKLEKEGFLFYSNAKIMLTEKGRLFYDTVAETLILT